MRRFDVAGLLLPVLVLGVSGAVLLAARFGVAVTGVQQTVATVFATLALVVILLGARRE